MKKIYVLNLDSRRLLVVVGVLLLLGSLCIYLGMQIGAAKANSQPVTRFNNHTADIPIVDPKLPANQQIPEVGFLTAQSESEKLVSGETAPRDPLVREAESNLSSLQLQDDPFIHPPPKRKTNIVKNTETKHNTTASKSVSGTVRQTFYTIQVAAFIREQDAQNLNSRLLKLGYTSRVERGNKFWFVRVGKENRPEKLQAQANKLRQENFDIFIKKQET